MFGALHVGRGTTRGAMTLFPVWHDGPALRGLRTGAGLVEVREREGSPTVPNLVVSNPTDKLVLLVEGELLEGGWQNRVMASSWLLAPRAADVVEVACVEQGRWHGAADHSQGGRRAPVSVRAASYTGADGPLPGRDRQGEVWRRVERQHHIHGPSATGSLLDAMDSGHVRRARRHITAGLRPLPGQSGVIVALAGYPVLLEVYDSNRTLRAHWSALLESFTVDAMTLPEVPTPGQRARDFAVRVEQAALEPVAMAGAGLQRVGRAGSVSVRGLELRDRPVHLVAVNERHPVAVAA